MKPDRKTTARGGLRRDAIAKAVFDLIVEVGIEGLRTRDVADRVGINIATLHYHFPTKHDLIEAVLHLVSEAFVGQNMERLDAHAEAGRTPGALERLHEEFDDARAVIEQRPELQVVLAELKLLARRDLDIAAMLSPYFGYWRGAILAILTDGVEDGSFRPDLDPGAGADLYISAMWGAATMFPSDVATFDRLCGELERAFVGEQPGGAARRLARLGGSEPE